jgi:hypothetical protein
MRINQSAIRRGFLLTAVGVLLTPIAAGIGLAAPKALPGSWSISPSSVAAGAGPSTYTFRYTTKVAVTNGAASIAIPSGFGVPQNTNGSGANFVLLQRGTCASSPLPTVVIDPDGTSYPAPRVAILGFKCTKANQYVAFTMSRVTAPTAPGAYPFAGFAAYNAPVVTLATTTVTVTPGAAKQLVLVTGPFSFAAGNTMGATTVAVRDQYGNATTSTAPITIGGTGPLTGTLTKNAVAGSATFTNLTTTVAGLGYTFVATSPGLTSANSAYNVFPAAASVVSFATHPTNTHSGSEIDDVVVSVRDQYGNPTAGTASVAVGNNPRGAVLGGTLTQTLAANGDATFDNLTMSEPEVGATLVASSPGVLTNATSSAFDVTLLTITTPNPGTAWISSLGYLGYNFFQWGEDTAGNAYSDVGRTTYGPVLTSVPDAGALGHVWETPSLDPRALSCGFLCPMSAAAWYGTDFNITVTVPSGTNYLSAYAVDWDTTDRAETITMDDGTGPQPVHLTAFNGGVFVVAAIDPGTTTVTLHVTNDGLSPNAVISAVFAN